MISILKLFYGRFLHYSKCLLYGSQRILYFAGLIPKLSKAKPVQTDRVHLEIVCVVHIRKPRPINNTQVIWSLNILCKYQRVKSIGISSLVTRSVKELHCP